MFNHPQGKKNYHEEPLTRKKVQKLTKFHQEVLHIYVHPYSAYKNKNIVTIHTFIKMDLKTP